MDPLQDVSVIESPHTGISSLPPPPFPRPWSSIVPMSSHHTPPISIDGSSGSGGTHHLDTSNLPDCVSSCNRRRATIDLLPNDVILNIFHFVRVTYPIFPNGLSSYSGNRDTVEWRRSWWRLCIHVCRTWRSVIFASPIFLDLKLVCTRYTRVDLIAIWPPFPIVITNDTRLMPEDYDIDAVIMHRNRVCEINLRLTSPQLQRWASAMQEQFPALTRLRLDFEWDVDWHRPERRSLAPALPDGFLGGSAPRLQSLELTSIPYPALLKLLLSATDLVHLTLWYIPHSGYISPEVIVAALAVLAHLEYLTIGFESPVSCPVRERRSPPPATRTVLSSLTCFRFRGVSEYLEVLVARIDVPLLDDISISFFHQLIFDTPQLAQFMRRATGLKAYNEARVDFRDTFVGVEFLPRIESFNQGPNLNIQCGALEWQLSSLAQLFTSFSPSIYTVEHLYIYSTYSPTAWKGQDDIENMQWLEIFHSFTAVKNLYVSKEYVQGIALALQELVGDDVLPALDSLFLEGFQSSGPVQEAIGQFVATRQLSDHFVTVSHWNSPKEIVDLPSVINVV